MEEKVEKIRLMQTKLFDIEGGNVIPSEHCYTIKWLKDFMTDYAENDEYLKVYAFLFYMSCPDPELNPYFNYIESEKEEQILDDLDANFTSEEVTIHEALEKCKKMYETPNFRAYMGIKKALDNIAYYMSNTSITDGRDGNIGQIRAVAKDFDSIRQSFKGAYKDLKDEQTPHHRGGKGLAYDQG
jgi:hypothetical protein